MYDSIADYLYNGTIGDYIVENIRSASEYLIQGKYSQLSQAIHPTISIALVFAITVHGLRVMTGDAISTLKQLIITSVWVVIALTLVTPSIFFNVVYLPFFEVKDSLTAYLMVGSHDKTVYGAFSEANIRMFAHAGNILDKAGMTDVSMIATALIIYIIYGAYYAIFVAVTLYCELAVNILMLLSCLIIPLSGFQSGRGLGKSWLIALIKYFVVFVIIGFIVSLLNIISDAFISELMAEVYSNRGGGMDTDAVQLNSPIFGGTLICGLFGVYLMYQAMEFASEITGGVMSDGKTGATAIGNAANAARQSSLGGMAKKGIKSGGLGLAKAAANKATNKATKGG